MHSALKKLAVLVTLVGERVVLRHVTSPTIHAAVAAITIGCFPFCFYSTPHAQIGALIAGWGDLEFDLTGYIFAGLSCIIQASFLLLLKVAFCPLTILLRLQQAQIAQAMSNMGLLYYNA